MKTLVRISAVLLAGAVLLSLPRTAAAQDCPAETDDCPQPPPPPPAPPPPAYPYAPPPAAYPYAPPPAYAPPTYRRPRLRHWLQTIDRSDVYIGGALIGAFMTDQSGNVTGNGRRIIGDGIGGQVILGFRLAPVLALELGYASTAHDRPESTIGLSRVALHQATADLKIIFPGHSPVRPFIQGGGGYYGLSSAEQRWLGGGGFQAGGGVDLWLDRWWSIGVRVLYHGLKLGRLSSDALVLDKPFLGWVSADLNLQIHF
jgi:hypothetical protein